MKKIVISGSGKLQDKIFEIEIDREELSNYKWIDIDELSRDFNYGQIKIKIQKFL